MFGKETGDVEAAALLDNATDEGNPLRALAGAPETDGDPFEPLVGRPKGDDTKVRYVGLDDVSKLNGALVESVPLMPSVDA